jgi:excisionase family DNA binding protein
MNPATEDTLATKPSHEDLDALLTVEEVASLLKVPPSWVYERTRQRGLRRLPFIKLGKYVRFEPAAVRAFLVRLRESA